MFLLFIHCFHFAGVSVQISDMCACVPTPAIGDDSSVEDTQYWQQRALRPRACPDHVDFLGQAKPVKLCMRYPNEHYTRLLEGLEGLWPLALAAPRAGNDKGSSDKSKWILEGLTGDSLGLTIRCSHKHGEPAQAECANTPPTPKVCAACRARRHGLNAAASDNPSLAGVTSSQMDTCACPPPVAKANNTGRTKLPRSPLYRSTSFPTIQTLLSKSATSEGLGGVTPNAFCKLLLRIKPELRALVPALAQADADADAEAKANAARDAGLHGAAASAHNSPHNKAPEPRSATVPVQEREQDRSRGNDSKDGVKHSGTRSQQVVHKDQDAWDDEDEDDDVPLAIKLLKLKEQQAQKEECASKDSADKDKDAGLSPSVSTQKKKAQSASKGDEHSDEDDDEDFDMAMAVRMLQKVKKLERAAAAVVLQCDTPPEQQEPPPCGAAKAEDPPRDPLSHKKKNKRKLDDEPLQQRTDKPARGCSSSGGGSSSRSSAQTPRRDAKAMYERKRWKVMKIVDTQRSDGSWALTVRLRRKRALCEGE